MTLIDDYQQDVSAPHLELPTPPVGRWTPERKAIVLQAVRAGQVSIDEVCRRYVLSLDEYLAWERDVGLFGTPGLRVTRYQIYRNMRDK